MLRHEGGRLLVEVVSGPPEGLVGATMRTDGTAAGAVLDGGEPVVVDNALGDGRVAASGFPAEDGWPELASLALLPMRGSGAVAGILALGWSTQSEQLYQDTDLRLPASYAEQATLALHLAQAQEDRGRLAVFEDRDRIGRDLHDLVIQRLFATGMQLEGVVRQIADPVPQGRVRQAVDDLDQTIREIRSTIYALNHEPHLESTSLRVRLLEVVDAAEEVLGFAPSLRLSGLLDTTVPGHLAEHIMCVLREALSNVARHAKASRVSVDIEAYDDVVVRVVDDGVGVSGVGLRSGLKNLGERAAMAGGLFEAAPGPVGGTELLWRAPLTR